MFSLFCYDSNVLWDDDSIVVCNVFLCNRYVRYIILILISAPITKTTLRVVVLYVARFLPGGDMVFQ
jgi:hypothetical protein